jgi:hypothetical protein
MSLAAVMTLGFVQPAAQRGAPLGGRLGRLAVRTGLGAAAMLAASAAWRAWAGDDTGAEVAGIAAYVLAQLLTGGEATAPAAAAAAADPPPVPPAPVAHRPPAAGPEHAAQPEPAEEPEAAEKPEAGPPAEAVGAELRRYGEVADVLKRQIGGAVEGTEAAALSIVAQLTSLDAAVQALLDALAEAERASTETAARGLAEMAAMREAVRSLRALVAARSAEVAADRDNYKRISQEGEVCAAALDTIGAIAFQSRIIGMNAAIEAARAGEAGRGFAIIAHDVRSLAAETSKAASAGEGLARLRAITDARLSRAVDGTDEAALLDAAERQAMAAEAGFGRLVAQAGSMLAAAQNAGAAVAASVTEAFGAVQFQDIVRQRLGQVGEGLDRLALHADGLAGALAMECDVAEVEDEVLGPMQDAYVMQSQHDAHDGAEAGAESLIELF